MAIDTSKIVAADQKILAAVDALIIASQAQAAKVADLSKQLADAIAANDPAAQAAVQAQLDQVAADLGAEADKASAAMPSSS